MKNKEKLYQENIIDHAKYPRNYGLLKRCDFRSGQHNPSCGDAVSLCGLVCDGTVAELRFEGEGCTLSLAMASMLTEYAHGKSIDHLRALDQDIVKELLGISLGPNRLQCGWLAVQALQDGLNNFVKSNKNS